MTIFTTTSYPLGQGEIGFWRRIGKDREEAVLNYVIGPQPTLTNAFYAAPRLSHCCRSCIAQHFGG